MAFVRIDLQLTEEQSVIAAEALGKVLPGFRVNFKKMMDAGPQSPGHHMEFLYRSREVQSVLSAFDSGAKN